MWKNVTWIQTNMFSTDAQATHYLPLRVSLLRPFVMGRRLRKGKRRRSEHCWWNVTTWVNFIGGTSMTSVGDMRRRWRHRQRGDYPSKLPWAWALINWRWLKIVSTQLLLDMLLGLLQHVETVTEISVSKMARHYFCDSCRPYSHSMCKPNGSLGRTALCAGVATKNWRDVTSPLSLFAKSK
jgi:hypothetical protein